MYDWKDFYDRMVKFTRIETMPVGLKYFTDRKDLPKAVKIVEKNQALCQFMAQARMLGRPTVGVPEYADRCSLGTYCTGFGDLGEEFKSGKRNLGTYQKNIENNDKFFKGVDRFEKGKWDAFLAAPIPKYNEYAMDPDVVAVYGFPAQIMRYIQGWVFMGEPPVEARTYGDMACSEVWVGPIVRGEPRLVVPCNGERVFCGAQNYEMAISMPGKDVEKILVGIEAMHTAGIRYPITSNILDASPTPPAAYFIRPEDYPGTMGHLGLEVLKKYGYE